MTSNTEVVGTHVAKSRRPSGTFGAMGLAANPIGPIESSHEVFHACPTGPGLFARCLKEVQPEQPEERSPNAMGRRLAVIRDNPFLS